MRSRSSITEQVHNQRWWFGFAMGSAAMVILLLRLLQLQWLDGEQWAERALQNRVYANVTAPGRSVLLDRYGQPLVLNAVDYFALDQPEALFSAQLLVSADQGRALLATNSGAIRMQFHRTYPLGPVLAHTLGYVTPVTAEELLADKQLRAVDQTGKQGLEKMLDARLRGAPGEEQFEISATGTKRRLLTETPSVAGAPLQTTLDPFLSAVSHQALGDNRGAVVLADASSGELLALVSTPSFDPNVFTERFSDGASESARRNQVNDYFTDPRNLFFNRAVSGTYPPGSVFKLVTALAALQSGKVTAATEVIDEGVLKVGDFSFANWYFSQYGRTEGAIDLQRSIARSNDIYFYKVAEAAGPDLIAQWAHQLGFGQPVGIELPGEAAGIVPDPKWKELVKGERWFLGNTYHYGIGQGDLLVTPIQVAQLIQSLANDGERCNLHLMQKDTRDCQNLSVPTEQLSLILNGMIDACSPGGTAFPLFEWNRARLTALAETVDDDPEQKIDAEVVACKTGTAEFGGSDGRGYKKTHGWFAMTVGLEPLIAQLAKASASGQLVAAADQSTQNPSLMKSRSLPLYLDRSRWLAELTNRPLPKRIALVVLVESDESRPYREGSRDAAPVAKTILDWMVGATDRPQVASPSAEVHGE